MENSETIVRLVNRVFELEDQLKSEREITAMYFKENQKLKSAASDDIPLPPIAATETAAEAESIEMAQNG